MRNYPYFDVVNEDETLVSVNDLSSYQGNLSVGIFTTPDPTGDTAHPDVSFLFGEIRGEMLLLTVEFSVICFESPELAAALFTLSQSFAVKNKPLETFIDELGELGISPWQQGGDAPQGDASLSA